MQIKAYGAESWLFPNSCGGADKAELHTARNSYANVQLKVENLKKSAVWSIEFEGNAFTDIRLYRLLRVTVNRNSDFFEPLDTKSRTRAELEKYFTKKAPFEVYDPLEPIEGKTVELPVDALYLSVKIPTNTAPGCYKGVFRLFDGAETAELPIEIKVYGAAVPTERRLNMANWTEPSPAAYGAAENPDKMRETREKIALLGRHAGQNCIFVSTALFKCKKTGDEYIYDFSEVENYVERLLKMGYSRIEAAHVDSIYRRLAEPTEQMSAETDTGIFRIKEFLTQWYEFLSSRGWKNITLQHIGDEPKDATAERYARLSAAVKEIMPDITTVDAVLTPAACKYVDIPVLLTRHYQLHKKEYDREISGKEVWFYTCCWPTAPYLNRFLDMPLISVRLIHWLNYKLGMNGYLHWGFCSQAKNQDVYKEPSVPFKIMGVPESREYLPAGDTNIVYPTQNGPLGSARLEMMRAGAEDYELLCGLDKATAAALTDKLINADWCAKTDTAGFEKVHIELLEACGNNE